jgi:uncharacterized protein YlzI (FlbEa/FlbD family)
MTTHSYSIDNQKFTLSPNSIKNIDCIPQWAKDKFDEIKKTINVDNGKMWSVRHDEDDTLHIISKYDDMIRHDLVSKNNYVYYYIRRIN